MLMKLLGRSKVEAFIDSNVILRYLCGDIEAKKLLDAVEVGFINPVVVSEVLYGYIRLATGLKPYELKEKFHEIVDLDLNPAFESLSDFILLPLPLKLEEVKELIEKYRLLPNDALITLTCKHYRIGKIISFDKDFKRIDFLETLP